MISGVLSRLFGWDFNKQTPLPEKNPLEINELLVRILSFADNPSIAQVSRQWMEISRNELLAKELLNAYRQSKVLCKYVPFEMFKKPKDEEPTEQSKYWLRVEKIRKHIFSFTKFPRVAKSLKHIPLEKLSCLSLNELMEQMEPALKLVLKDLDLIACFNKICVQLSEDQRPENLFLADASVEEKAKQICSWLQANQEHLKEVEELDFSDLGLYGVPSEIGLFTGLKNLDLSKNKIFVLSRESIESLKNLDQLKDLSLKNNQLKELPPEIGNLTSLVALNLECNQLKELPPEIGNLTQLEALSLEHNRLKELPSGIGNLTKLGIPNRVNLPRMKQFSLWLSYNKLEKLPPEIGKLTQLKGLYLQYNQLKKLPSEIGNLSQLKTLVLSYNHLEEFPQETNKLENLTLLMIDNNHLKELPKEIGNLKSLEILRLQDNRLETLSSEIAKLTNLEQLDVRNNKLTSLPLGLMSLSKLCLKRGNNPMFSKEALDR